MKFIQRKTTAQKAESLAAVKGKTLRDTNASFKRWQLYLLAAPAIIYIVLFAYKPMYGIVIAFKDYKMKLGITDSPWADPIFKNFLRLFKSYWFPTILKNTLLLSGLSLLLGFPLPIILALLVNELRNGKAKKTFQIISYAPHFISTVVVCSMITIFLTPSTGILNKLIELFGGDVYILQSSTAFKWIYVISGLWQEAGWGAIIYYATLSAVDKNLLEAAELDGANRFQRMIHINLPVLIPTISIMFILRCGSLLSVGYEKIYLLQNDLNLVGSEVISTYVYKMGLESLEFSFSTATGLFNSVVNCIFLVIANGFSKKASGSSLW